MEEKVWFIKINGNSEGPLSINDLKFDKRITPDTLVWKEGFPKWIPIRYVQELKEIFKDEEAEQKPKDQELPIKFTKIDDEITLDLHYNPLPFLFWILILITLLLYFIFDINR